MRFPLEACVRVKETNTFLDEILLRGHPDTVRTSCQTCNTSGNTWPSSTHSVAAMIRRSSSRHGNATRGLMHYPRTKEIDVQPGLVLLLTSSSPTRISNTACKVRPVQPLHTSKRGVKIDTPIYSTCTTSPLPFYIQALCLFMWMHCPDISKQQRDTADTGSSLQVNRKQVAPNLTHTQYHIHTYTYIHRHIYIYICVLVWPEIRSNLHRQKAQAPPPAKHATRDWQKPHLDEAVIAGPAEAAPAWKPDVPHLGVSHAGTRKNGALLENNPKIGYPQKKEIYRTRD